MIIKTVIMAHPSRSAHANKLKQSLIRQQLYADIIWDTDNNVWNTARRCLLAGMQADWTIVLQDDSIIGSTFADNAVGAITTVPQDTLISFYTGTTKPFARRVTAAVEQAKDQDASWIVFDRLCWGVGTAINSKYIKPLLDELDNSSLPHDER